jgi:hypothetical protein
MTDTQPLSDAVLQQFTGTEQWYRHGLTGVLYTDGAKYVAETAKAYWLLDEIAIAQRFEKALAAEEFQVWVLNVRPDKTARLWCSDGNDDDVVFAKQIEYTDFPTPGIELWFANNTIYLPSEH